MMDGVLGRVEVGDTEESLGNNVTGERFMQAWKENINGGAKMVTQPKVDYNPIIDNKVSHPNHYQSKSGLECKDVLNAATEELSGYEAVWTANAIKYLWRWKKKNGDEDLRKAIECVKFILDEHLKEAL